MDIADQAQLQNELREGARLAYRKPEGPKATGRCLNCNDVVPKGQKFCDIYCSEDWDYREKMRRIGR